jgi:hypothetical protein
MSIKSVTNISLNLVPRVLFVWPRAEENPGKGCENNPQFVDYFVTWYVWAAGADPGGSKRGLRHGQIFEIVIFFKLVYKDGSDRYLYV